MTSSTQTVLSVILFGGIIAFLLMVPREMSFGKNFGIFGSDDPLPIIPVYYSPAPLVSPSTSYVDDTP